MKKVILLAVLFIVMGTTLKAQIFEDNDNLKEQVELIIKNEIGYIPDSTTNQVPETKMDSTYSIHCMANLSQNPMTLLIVNGRKVDLASLEKYQVADVKRIDVYKKEHPMMLAFYGDRARNGAVVLEIKE